MQLGDTIVQVNGRSTLGEKSFDEMCAGETQLTLIAMRVTSPWPMRVYVLALRRLKIHTYQ